MTALAEVVVEAFPVVVIEVPKPLYHLQSKTSMRVASHKMGGVVYDGPSCSHLQQWKHISIFYIIELSLESYYLAQSLTHHPHYLILRSELPAFESLLNGFLKKNASSSAKRIHHLQNFQDDFLLVINNFGPFPQLQKFLSTIHDDDLLHAVVSQAQLDSSRGNLKIDIGYASGQNLVRATFGTTIPRILEKTHKPMYLEVQKDLSVLIDLVLSQFDLPQYHRLDDLHTRFWRLLHPHGIIPFWRVAISRPDQFLQVHEDSNNESQPLMSPVGVLLHLVVTVDGPLQLTKIEYSCKSLLDATLQESVILPIVCEFLEWERSQPELLMVCSNKLLDQPTNSATLGAIEFPCHLERSVGVSPYLHATYELQKLLSLDRHQCNVVLYHCVTNKLPSYFYEVFQGIKSSLASDQQMLSNKTSVQLEVWFHNQMQQLITKHKDVDLVLPRRHQPHNGRVTSTSNIELSIQNLVELCDQFHYLEVTETKKQFYHSKAIAILMKSPQEGGCHACGGLTSQTSLYSLSCLGLFSIVVSCWGKLAGTETAGYLEDHYQLSYSEGRAEQFLLCCVAGSEGLTEAPRTESASGLDTRNNSNGTLITVTPQFIQRLLFVMSYFWDKTYITAQ
jgi:hypothetical protein